MPVLYFSTRLLCYFLGFYSSYKAVKSKNIDRIGRWVTFWIILALFRVGESVGDVVVSWLPFYQELKLGFTVWLCFSRTRLSVRLYKRYVHPWLEEKESFIDGFAKRFLMDSKILALLITANASTAFQHVVSAVSKKTNIDDLLFSDTHTIYDDMRSEMEHCAKDTEGFYEGEEVIEEIPDINEISDESSLRLSDRKLNDSAVNVMIDPVNQHLHTD